MMTTITRFNLLLLAFTIGLSTGAGRVMPAKNETKGASSAAFHAGREGDPVEKMFLIYFEILFGSIIVALTTYRLITLLIQHVRTLACLKNDTQRYFAVPNDNWARIKQHVMYAPVFRTRHNREFRLSEATHFGTLPTRFQALVLVTYLGTNMIFCAVSIPWADERKRALTVFRDRTGVLAVANMLPLFLMAGRNNPLVPMLGISFDTFNLIHRWVGRMVVLEAICHSTAFMIVEVSIAGWAGLKASIAHSQLIQGGFITIVAFVVFLIHSPSVIRHAFYEVFLHIHIALAWLSLVGLLMHLKDQPQFPILCIVMCFWAVERGIRLGSLIYRNLGNGGTKAEVQSITDEVVRVTLDVARPWTFRAGQHLYLYIPAIGYWTSHPFTVAWSEMKEHLTFEKRLVRDEQDVEKMQKSTLSLVIRGYTGFTAKLCAKAKQAPGGKLVLKALVEGPYGGIHSLHSYGTVLMFAGGIGISYHLSHVRELVDGYANGTVAARKVILVWAIRSGEHLDWIKPWLTDILAMERRREVLRIMLFITRPHSRGAIRSPSLNVQMFLGRPNIPMLIKTEMVNQIGTMAVTVCGTGSMSDDVRHTVRGLQTKANIDLVEETFTW